MAEGKKSFIGYADWKSHIQLLTDEEAGKVFKHLLEYVNDEYPEFNSTERLLIMAFEPIKQSLKRDLRKYEEVKLKRSESGRLGGLKSGETRSKTKQIDQNEANEANASFIKQTEANEAVSVNDSVSDSDILLVKESKHTHIDNTISLKEKSEKKIEKIEFVENSKYGSGELHFKILKFAEENKGKYSKDFYYDFLEYWTAPLQKGVNKGKELWKTKETFSLGGRLSTWNKINNQKNGGNSRESKEEYLKRVGSDIDDIFKRKEQTGNYFGIDLTRQGQSTNDLSGYSEYTNVG